MKVNKNLKKIIDNSYIFLDMQAHTKEEAISELLIRSEAEGLRINIANIITGIYKKESIVSSGLGYGVAFPHTPTDEVEEETIIFGVSRQGVDYESLDKHPAHLIIMFLTPAKKSNEEYLTHLSIFTKISKLSMYVILLMESKTKEEFRSKLFELIENIN